VLGLILVLKGFGTEEHRRGLPPLFRMIRGGGIETLLTEHEHEHEKILAHARRGFRANARQLNPRANSWYFFFITEMKTQGIGPVFQVSSLDGALKYYQKVLGFKEDFQFGAYAGISHGDACVHLCAHRFHQRPIGGGTAFVFCDEVDEYFQEIKKNGAIVKVEPADQPYGMRDFVVLDPDGNQLNFGCGIRPAGVADHT